MPRVNIAIPGYPFGEMPNKSVNFSDGNRAKMNRDFKTFIFQYSKTY